MSSAACAVIVPAFNEERSIGRVVASLRPVAPVIVVDDASSDETAFLAVEAGAIVVQHSTNRGYGAAIESGFGEAVERGFRHVVTADGDGQHDPDEVKEFVELLDGGFDLVVGIRPGPRRPVEALCAWYARHALGVQDPLCGLKGYDVRFYREYGGFDRRRSVGTELMAFALRHGARWTQRPIRLRERDHGGSRFYTTLRGDLRILRALLALVRVR